MTYQVFLTVYQGWLNHLSIKFNVLHQFRNNHDTSIANLFFVCTKENSLLQLRIQLWISAIEGHPFDN